MSLRLRKLLGTLALLALIAAYSLLVMVLASTVVPSLAGWAHVIFYAAAGFAWVPAAGWIVGWMHKSRPAEVAEDGGQG